MPEVDSYLRSQVRDLQNMVVGLSQSVTVVGQQVGQVGQEQRETHDDLTALRTEFTEYVKQAERTASIQRAETRVGVLQDELEHEFGHHNVVRRSATGMLQAFDVGLVSEETVHAVSEQLMVQTPRYWLAPVLVALARWAGDDPEGCARAIEEAFRRSPDKTSLFMALVLRRQGRLAASVRWLRHYLNAQDPMVLGRDFAVILESISQGAFGPAGMELVQECLERWRAQLLNDESVLASQVKQWRAEVDGHVAAPTGPRFPRLATVSPQWPQMEGALARAEAHRPLLDKYTALMAEEIVPNDRIEDAVDDILDRLVRDFDNDELPKRRELMWNEAVIEKEGDLAEAQRALENDAIALESTLDYLTIQTRSALNPATIGVSRSTQRIAVSACHEWFARAHAEFTRDYRMGLPPSVDAVFETNHSFGAMAFKLPRWTGSFTEPMAQLERSLAEHWDRCGQPYIEKFGFDWKKKAILPACVVAAALVLLSVCLGPLGFIAAVVGGGIWALVLYNQYQTSLRKQAEARSFIARCKQDSLTQLRGAGAELTDWSTRFREADQLEADVRAMIGDLATAGHAVSAYERRVVTVAPSTGA